MTSEIVTTLEFPTNIMNILVGINNRNISFISKIMNVSLFVKGNEITIMSTPKKQEHMIEIFKILEKQINIAELLETDDITNAIRLVTNNEIILMVDTYDNDDDNPFSQNISTTNNNPKKRDQQTPGDYIIKTPRKTISPRSESQLRYCQKIDDHDIVFSTGPAGTGKTYTAVAKAVELMQSGEVSKLIISRPAVEAGENLGFLPGDLKEKVDPFMRPIYDALFDMLPKELVERKIENGEIEIAPLAFMRGRTLSNAFVIMDEAQNTTHAQMKMFLTRFGQNSRMVINGDLTQVDLPRGVISGLREAIISLKKIKEIGFLEFTSKDVVRHHLVGKIIDAYAKRDKEVSEIYSHTDHKHKHKHTDKPHKGKNDNHDKH